MYDETKKKNPTENYVGIAGNYGAITRNCDASWQSEKL